MKITRRALFGLTLLLLLPALLINLGLLTFIDDEGIRSLVALEMDLSGNWITPTLHGHYYYKKPPLYNWILGAWYQITGEINEFYARIPTVVALLGYAASIFLWLRPKYGTRFAFLSALILITCGRILFYDSMLALIDMTFSWMMFLLFMVVYHFMEKKKYRSLFLLSYLLCAVGFLLKGLPSIVFQGTTLLAWFIYQKQFRKLFSVQHLFGGLVFTLLVGGYYLVYDQYNSLENVFTTLFTESTQRTPTNFSFWETFGHIFTFPLEMIYHFLPWSLFLLFFFRKDIRTILREDSFITYCVFIFLANILVYWISPEVYPRYLLMHAPLIFISYLYLYDFHRKKQTWQYRLVDRLLFGLMVLLSLAAWAPLFLETSREVSYYIPKTIFGVFILTGATIAYQLQKENRLLYLLIFLLGFRIIFNFFVLPDRNANDFGDTVRKQSKAVGAKRLETDLYVYKDLLMEPAISFYLTNSRGTIIPRRFENFPKDALYIIHPDSFPEVQLDIIVDSLPLRHGERPVYKVAKIKNQ
ncbi:MAG TPA: glycosyltransferase family 39 protein [Saprospiraceae bacterium]|nr:glycosyltransferase family 39 protein [Saprospiraceae bacterium]